MHVIMILFIAVGLTGCGYCAPGKGGNVPGGKTDWYCTNKAGEGP